MVLHPHSHGHGHAKKRRRRNRSDSDETGHDEEGGDEEEGAENGRGQKQKFWERLRQRRRRGHAKKYGSEENINVRAAFIHVIGDLIQSVGVVIAGYIIWFYVSRIQYVLFTSKAQGMGKSGMAWAEFVLHQSI